MQGTWLAGTTALALAGCLPSAEGGRSDGEAQTDVGPVATDVDAAFSADALDTVDDRFPADTAALTPKARCELYCAKVSACLEPVCDPGSIDFEGLLASCKADCATDVDLREDAEQLVDLPCPALTGVLCADTPELKLICSCGGIGPPTDASVCGVEGVLDAVWERVQEVVGPGGRSQYVQELMILRMDGTFRTLRGTYGAGVGWRCVDGDFTILCDSPGAGQIWTQSECDDVPSFRLLAVSPEQLVTDDVAPWIRSAYSRQDVATKLVCDVPPCP